MAQQFGITRLKNNMNIIVLQRKMYATFIFYDFPEHTAPIFKTFKILKRHGIIQLSILGQFFLL